MFSILIFQKRVWELVLCMIFQEKCFLCYILLANQISLSDCQLLNLIFFLNLAFLYTIHAPLYPYV